MSFKLGPLFLVPIREQPRPPLFGTPRDYIVQHLLVNRIPYLSVGPREVDIRGVRVSQAGFLVFRQSVQRPHGPNPTRPMPTMISSGGPKPRPLLNVDQTPPHGYLVVGQGFVWWCLPRPNQGLLSRILHIVW